MAMLSLNRDRLETYLYRSRRIGARAESLTKRTVVQQFQARGKAHLREVKREERKPPKHAVRQEHQHQVAS